MKKLIGLLSISAVLSLPLSAAIAFDTAVDGLNNNGTTSSLSWTHTMGATGMLAVCFLGDAITGNDDITSVNAGSSGTTPMTLVGKTTGGVNTNRFTYLYILQNAPSGSNTVSITSTNNHFLLGTSASWTGTATSGQPDNSTAFTPANSSPYTTSLTPVANNTWVVLCDGGSSPVAGSGVTQRVRGAAFSEPFIGDSNGAISPPASTSMTTTASTPPDDVHIMMSICVNGTGCAGGAVVSPGVKEKKLNLTALAVPNLCAGMTAPDCNGYTNGGSAGFACLFADGSCAAATIVADPLALTSSGAVTIGTHVCMAGANLGGVPVIMGSLGSIDPGSFSFDCTQ